MVCVGGSLGGRWLFGVVCVGGGLGWLVQHSVVFLGQKLSRDRREKNNTIYMDREKNIEADKVSIC